MNSIKFEDFVIIPLLETVKILDISDEEYFSDKYADYISNSKLKHINPKEGGSYKEYFVKSHSFSSASLDIGTAVHQMFLQPDEFEIVHTLRKPSAKLGTIVNKIIKYRAEGLGIYDSMQKAVIDADYYKGVLNKTRIKKIIEGCTEYYIKVKSVENPENKIILSKSNYNVVTKALASLNNNLSIKSCINALDLDGDPMESHNEKVIIMDILVKYLNQEIVLKLKMKGDNWTVDETENKIILNDLKTTGKPINYFMSNTGSFKSFHYFRQLAMYSWMLKQYYISVGKFNSSWNIDCNILLVETIMDFKSRKISIPRHYIKSGLKEMNELLSRVAYYQIFGYNKNINFV